MASGLLPEAKAISVGVFLSLALEESHPGQTKAKTAKTIVITLKAIFLISPRCRGLRSQQLGSLGNNLGDVLVGQGAVAFFESYLAQVKMLKIPEARQFQAALYAIERAAVDGENPVSPFRWSS